MAHRGPARLLAPIALVGFVIALAIVVSSSGGTSQSGSPSPAARPSSKSGAARTHRRVKRVYVVKAGDTPSSISARTGVPLATIQKLNPKLDPQLMAVGDKIRLR